MQISLVIAFKLNPGFRLKRRCAFKRITNIVPGLTKIVMLDFPWSCLGYKISFEFQLITSCIGWYQKNFMKNSNGVSEYWGTGIN
jgi:hypothetical protein